jgi:hypothetical protein
MFHWATTNDGNEIIALFNRRDSLTIRAVINVVLYMLLDYVCIVMGYFLESIFVVTVAVIIVKLLLKWQHDPLHPIQE